MKSNRPVILVDIDDTLNEFAPTYWKTYNETYEEEQDHSQIDSWDLQEYVRSDVDAYELLKHPGLFRYIPLKPYAEQFMKNIYKKYQVYVVTDSPPGTSHCELKTGVQAANPADDKRKWMKEHFPYFPQDQIIICSHKWMISGDVLIDDKPATFEKFRDLGKKCVLIDMPYNRYIDTKWRAKDLVEAERMIEEILAVDEVVNY